MQTHSLQQAGVLVGKYDIAWKQPLSLFTAVTVLGASVRAGEAKMS
jgi:hypothetical protein